MGSRGACERGKPEEVWPLRGDGQGPEIPTIPSLTPPGIPGVPGNR